MPKRNTALGGLDYSRCRKSDLQQFFKNRTGQDVPEKTIKNDIVKMLRKVDRQPWKYGSTFRFLDLPPELRNVVYEYVLAVRPVDTQIQPGDKKCLPDILGVCKQIQFEAESVLYADEEGEVEIRLHFAPDIRGSLRAIHHTKVFAAEGRRVEQWPVSLKDSRQEWPPSLKKFRSLKITANMVKHRSLQSHPHLKTGLHHELYRLTSFLRESKVLQNVVLEVTYRDGNGGLGDTTQVKDLADALAPLARLDRETTVSVTGVSARVEKLFRLERKYNKSKSAKNVLADFMRIRQRLLNLQDLEWLIYAQNETATASTIDQLNKMQNALDIKTYVSEEEEDQLEMATQEAEEFMNGGVVDEVDKLVAQNLKERRDDAVKDIRKVREKKDSVRQQVREINKELKEKILEIETMQRKVYQT